MQSKAVFLDKDGTLIPDIPYNIDPLKITFFEDIAQSLAKLKDLEYKFFIISNQSGIGRGFFTKDDLSSVIDKMYQLFSDNDLSLGGFYYCPHFVGGTIHEYSIECDCRKPQPGMILKASADHDIDIQKSWFIGDILNDIEAGNRAGCKTILINNGNETEWQEGTFRVPNFTVSNFSEATEVILKHSNT